MVDVFTPYVCVLVAGFHNINRTRVIIMVGHIMESRKNESGEINCDLIVVINLERLHIHTRWFGGHDTYSLDINAYEIELILN